MTAREECNLRNVVQCQRRREALLIQELARLRQQAADASVPRGAVCQACQQPIPPRRVGRPAKFCSAGCRLRFWRETKRNET